MARRFLSVAQVCDKVCLSRTALWRRVKAGTFPQSIRIGHRTTIFLEDEVEAWMQAQVKVARGAS
jgi:prophage regulatory protein